MKTPGTRSHPRNFDGNPSVGIIQMEERMENWKLERDAIGRRKLPQARYPSGP
jgi:hypothetical protein